MQRGEIRNRQFMAVNNFSGLRWGAITPTDLDGLIDFGNRLFVFVELKFKGAALPYGQKLALERVVDAIESVPTIAIIAQHETPAGQDIDAARAIVTAYRWERRWYTPSRVLTLKDAIDIMHAQFVQEAS